MLKPEEIIATENLGNALQGKKKHTKNQQQKQNKKLQTNKHLAHLAEAKLCQLLHQPK